MEFFSTHLGLNAYIILQIIQDKTSYTKKIINGINSTKMKNSTHKQIIQSLSIQKKM